MFDWDRQAFCSNRYLDESGAAKTTPQGCNGVSLEGASRAAARIGYARVSTDEQNLDLQLQALQAAGCERIFEDHGVSGRAIGRPGLAGALDRVQGGDVLVVWKLDRLGRSLPHLVETINGLREAGVGFLSLQEQIDTTSAGGRFYLHILAALAEFERELISERTKAGMAAAKRRGNHIGRPRKLSAQQIHHARELIASGKALSEQMVLRPRGLAHSLGG